VTLLGIGVAIAALGRGLGMAPGTALADGRATVDLPSSPRATDVSPLGRATRDAAGLVVGAVQSMSFSYDEANGPRTNVDFRVDAVHAGSIPSKTLTLSVFGGFRPDGRFTTATHQPTFAEGGRYLLLLRSSGTYWSPIVEEYSFRVESVEGEDIVVGQEGHAVISISFLGAQYAEEASFEPVKFDGNRFAPGPRIQGRTIRRSGPSRVLRLHEVVAAILDGARVEAADFQRPFPGLRSPSWYPWNEVPTAVGETP
jgi:hypothetical protein